MLTAEEAIKKFKKFERRANAKRSKQIEQIKADRKFLSGEQWSSDDDAWWPNGRPRRVINVLGNSIASTVNVYATYGYKWYSPDEETDQGLEAFLKFGSNARAAYDVLYNEVAFGLGYFALGSEQVTAADGEVLDVPALYSIDKLENVYFDPDSIEIDGHDAQECAITEFRSKEWVEAKYGEEWVTPKGERPVVNVTDNADPEQMVIVTYYRMEEGRCQVYRMLNRDFLDDPVELEIDRIPVFPCYGARSWDSNDDLIWEGLVHKGKPIQILLNYCFSQLSERMAMSPKPTFITSGDSVEDLEGPYKTFQYNSNPLLIYNRTTPDGKTVLEPPQRLDNTVRFDDITGIIGAQLELLSTITGVDAKGLMNGDQPQVTATEVLYNERQTQCTIRHFYANLRDTFRAVGEVTCQLLNIGKRRIDVIQGPAEHMQLEIARTELMQLMGQVPEDKRMAFVNGIFLTHPENAVLRNVFGQINAQTGPTAMEAEAMQTVETMRDAIVQKDQQIKELQEQIKNMENAQANNERSLKADFAKAEIEHKWKQDDMILQAQLDQGLDASRAAIDNEKAQVDLQKSVVQLDTAKVKADAEMMKAMVPQQKEVTNEDNAR